MTFKKCITLVCLLGFMLTLTACSREPSYSTPEKCFNAMAEAKKNDDIAGQYYCLAKVERDRLVGVTAWSMHMLSNVGKKITGGKETTEDIQELLKKHDLTEEKLKASGEKMNPFSKEFATSLEKLGAGVSDQVGFLEEAQKLAEKNRDEDDKKKDEDEKIPELTDVKIDGDTATGQLKIPDSSLNIPMHFVKEDGSWRISSKM